MATDEVSSAKLKASLSVMCCRANKQNVNITDVMNAMNSIQKFLIPKHQGTYLPFLERSLELLLLLCDDNDVSIRHTASVVLSSSVNVILPFQKSLILNFIANHINKAFQPHALIAMLDLELQVTLFLTQKVALQLFDESAPLFNYCAKSSSEIVSEGLFKLAPRIRAFFTNKEKRVKLISNLAKKKESVLAASWSTKTAAIFAYPDLIKVSLKFFNPPFNFLAAIPTEQLPNINFEPASLEELIPFVENDPPFFFNRLATTPSNFRELSAYFSCLKLAIPYGFKFQSSLLTDPKYKSDPILFSLQLECFAMASLRGLFDHPKIFEVFSDAINRKTACSLSSLAIVFNCYPSIQLFDMAINLPISSPSLSKSLIIFLTEIEFSKLLESRQFHNRAIDKLVKISQSNHEIVHNTMIERAPLFNNGRTYPLFKKLLSNFNYFDNIGFRNSLTLVSVLTTRDYICEINSIFANLIDVDPLIIYGDIASLTSFLISIRKICIRCYQPITSNDPKHNELKIPIFIIKLPLLVLRIIIALLTGEWNENHPTNLHFNKLLEEAKSNQLLTSVLSRLPLISLLEIRDKAASCISSIKVHLNNKSYPALLDERTLDLIGKKLINWPSKYNWLLISHSAKTLMMTTGGILSLDPKIALSAAMKNPDKFNSSMIHKMATLTAFAICNNIDIEFKLTIEFVKIMDKIAVDFPEVFVKKMKGSWLIVCIKHHIKHQLVIDFKEKPFETWSGPKQFWNLLPSFLQRIKNDDPKWSFNFDRSKCDEFHTFFALRNIRYFNHEPFADYSEISIPTNEEKKSNDIRLQPYDYYEPEMLRQMRGLLYNSVHCHSYMKLCMQTKSISNSGEIIESIIRFLSSEECGIECFSDALLLCTELSTIEQKDIDQRISPFLKMAPFRGISALHSIYLSARQNIPLILPNVQTTSNYLESELKQIIAILIKMGQIQQINIQPMSHFTSYQLAKVFDQSFFTCLRYNVEPHYSESNESLLKTHVAQYGISKFSMNCIEKWAKRNDLVQLINFFLNYATTNGTYYPNKLAHIIGTTMSLHPNVMPVVEAFILVLADSPFKKNLVSEFKNAQIIMKNK